MPDKNCTLSEMKVQSYFATHIGLVRDENQDSVFSHSEARLFIVADGMGGHQGAKWPLKWPSKSCPKAASLFG